MLLFAFMKVSFSEITIMSGSGLIDKSLGHGSCALTGSERVSLYPELSPAVWQ